jgi:hypothetical protein
MSDRLETWTAAGRIREAAGDLSAAEIDRMPMAEYARLRERAGLDPVDPFATAYSQYEPEHQRQDQPPAPEGIDPNSDEYFLAWRSQRARGGEGKGIFDSVGSQSDVYTNAVRQQAGRTAYSPETHHPGIARVFIQDSPVTGRQSWYR